MDKKYCKVCGSEMTIKKIPSDTYNEDTGERNIKIVMVCPVSECHTFGHNIIPEWEGGFLGLFSKPVTYCTRCNYRGSWTPADWM